MNLDGNKLTNVTNPDPNEPNDAVDIDYLSNSIAFVANTINDAFSLALSKDGTNAMTGDLNLGNNNVRTPYHDGDASKTKYIEDTLAKSH